MIPEYELRAPLDTAHLDRFLRILNSRGAQHAPEVRRLFVDYSTFLEGIEKRTRDIRIRRTDGRWELAIKTGDFSATTRFEALIPIGDVSTRDLLSAMALLGFTKGVVALRGIRNFEFETHVVSLQRIIMHDTSNDEWDTPRRTVGYLVEVEAKTEIDWHGEVEQQLINFLASYSLQPFTAQQWYDYVHELNRSANGVVDLTKPNWQAIDRWDEVSRTRIE